MLQIVQKLFFKNFEKTYKTTGVNNRSVSTLSPISIDTGFLVMRIRTYKKSINVSTNL